MTTMMMTTIDGDYGGINNGSLIKGSSAAIRQDIYSKAAAARVWAVTHALSLYSLRGIVDDTNQFRSCKGR